MQIAILLGTYNGAQYIQEQLDSFADQTYSEWIVWASDDGSIDRTVCIVKEFGHKVGSSRIHQIEGPKKGFAANFLSMVCDPGLKAEAYAYADQDDIWMKDKLERAANFLASVPANKPALYCSRTQYVDKDNRSLKVSKDYSRPAVFKNALVQNIASGNTMVFNEAARSLLLKIGVDPDASLHDWLTYIVVSGAGGEIFFDKNPSVRYRQHSNNLIGMNTGLGAKLGRIRMLFKGRFREWNERHVRILGRVRSLLTSENIIVLEKFSDARRAKGFSRLSAFKRSGVYRQTLSNNLAFYIAAMFGKV